MRLALFIKYYKLRSTLITNYLYMREILTDISFRGNRLSEKKNNTVALRGMLYLRRKIENKFMY